MVSHTNTARRIIGVTEYAPQRPSAEEILAQLKDEGQDQDDSVLCVNMVAAGDTTASAL